MNLSLNEVNILSKLGYGFKLLRRCFAYKQVDAFLSLASMVTRGKKVSSPSKRIRRDGDVEIFCSLAMNLQLLRATSKRDESAASTIKIDEVSFVKSLQKLSSRWMIFTFDELTHLAAIIDEDEDGYISWNDFYLFCRRVEEALHASRIKNIEETLQILFEDLSFVFIEDDMNPLDKWFERKLIDIATGARIKDLHPLTQLFSFISPEYRHDSIDTSVLIQLFSSLGVTIQGDPAPSHNAMALVTPAAMNEENINSLLEDTLKYLRVHAKEIAARAQVQDQNTDKALQIWDALLNLERDLRDMHDGRRDPEAGASQLDDTLQPSPYPEQSLDMQPLDYAVEELQTTELHSTELQTTELNDTSRFADSELDYSPTKSMMGTSVIKEKYYFPKNALISSPYNTPQPGLNLNDVSASRAFEPSTIHSQGSGASPRGRKKSIASNYPSLDIMRSPKSRQTYDNKNVFDPSTLSWKPTVLTNKYNERFQYPADLAEASKMNSILFSGYAAGDHPGMVEEY